MKFLSFINILSGDHFNFTHQQMEEYKWMSLFNHMVKATDHITIISVHWCELSERWKLEGGGDGTWPLEIIYLWLSHFIRSKLKSSALKRVYQTSRCYQSQLQQAINVNVTSSYWSELTFFSWPWNCRIRDLLSHLTYGTKAKLESRDRSCLLCRTRVPDGTSANGPEQSFSAVFCMSERGDYTYNYVDGRYATACYFKDILKH